MNSFLLQSQFNDVNFTVHSNRKLAGLEHCIEAYNLKSSGHNVCDVMQLWVMNACLTVHASTDWICCSILNQYCRYTKALSISEC